MPENFPFSRLRAAAHGAIAKNSSRVFRKIKARPERSSAGGEGSSRGRGGGKGKKYESAASPVPIAPIEREGDGERVECSGSPCVECLIHLGTRYRSAPGLKLVVYLYDFCETVTTAACSPANPKKNLDRYAHVHLYFFFKRLAITSTMGSKYTRGQMHELFVADFNHPIAEGKYFPRVPPYVSVSLLAFSTFDRIHTHMFDLGVTKERTIDFPNERSRGLMNLNPSHGAPAATAAHRAVVAMTKNINYLQEKEQ
ncbi:hypothetical protein EVAR_82450_1 [Eumeta japonica]|uniref:Uncharacterized protein n=1 Tax=Eumeta variegata TaxID=151549 RepID=A0A4C1X5N6_EUMVA|nr:hypothetical protein EVAR_82450_1 [Eumeta japonica]